MLAALSRRASKFIHSHHDSSRLIRNSLSLCSYQYGPDTYLLQLRDTDFPTRLREYVKVAKGRSPSFNYSLSENNYDLSVSNFIHSFISTSSSVSISFLLSLVANHS